MQFFIVVFCVKQTSYTPVTAFSIPSCFALCYYSVKKVIFCSGKHYYALHQERSKYCNVAIIRVEELCPFPAAQLKSIITGFNADAEFVWAQEEPRNMGAWMFVMPRFLNLLGIQVR